MTTIEQPRSKLPVLISLLLVIALGISLAKLMWLIITPKQQLRTQATNTELSNILKQEKVNYGKIIASQHIFGEIKKKPVIKKTEPPKTAKTAIVATKLNLKLHGIVAYKSKEGFVLISSSNGPQKVYGKGESIQKGVTVTEIFPTKVMLDNNGKAEELLLPIDKKSGNSRRTPSSFGNLPGNQPKRNTNKSPLSNNAADLGAIRRDVLSNPVKLMDIARPSPAMSNGKFIGFRVQPGKNRKLFRQLGFRPNDIITEVNGIILDNASKGAMVLSELTQAEEISVKIKRGNQELFIERSF